MADTLERPCSPGPGCKPVAVAPLSHAQERMWFAHKFRPDAPAYNTALAYLIRGPLDAGALEAGLNDLIRRHEPLRTIFAEQAGRPVQVVVEPPPVKLLVETLDGEAGKDDPPSEEGAMTRWAVSRAREVFDLTRDPPIRAHLAGLGPERHLLVVVIHHIAFDGWSVGILLRELAGFYGAHLSGRPSDPPPLRTRYRDYAQRQRGTGPDAGADSRKLQPWLASLRGAPLVLELPLDHPRPPIQTFEGARVRFEVPRAVARSLWSLGREHGATLFMTLLASFLVLLHRYTGRPDILVGSPFAGRTETETEKLIGLFVNTLPIRGDLSGDPSFIELLLRTREAALTAYDHQEVPFERLVEALQPERTPSLHPVFQSVFVLQSSSAESLSLPGLTSVRLPLDLGSSTFDLILEGEAGEDGLRASLAYGTNLFERATIDRMVSHYLNLLAGIAENPGARISRLPLLSAQERRLALVDWAAGPRRVTRESVVDLVAEQIRKRPEAPAVVWKDEILTYAELDLRSARLAGRLRGMGVRRGTLVGVCLERSPGLIVALLAVLRAGGAYLPLDPTYPPQRLAFMVRDSGSPVMITERHHEALLMEMTSAGAPNAPGPGFVFADEVDPSAGEERGPFGGETLARPDDPAYVIYTSGSTGRPKGVIVPHRGVVRLVRGANYVRWGPDEVVLQGNSPGFDASVVEIWGALANGARLILAPAGPGSIEGLAELIRSSGVTIALLVTPVFNHVVDNSLEMLSGLSQLMFGGEAASPPHVARAVRGLPGCRVVNVYGPTENATLTTTRTLRPADLPAPSVPIGRPVSGTTVYILDRAMEPVPPGVTGELYTGGEGLAYGYLGRPDLTAERFVPHPFGEAPGARLYRTGDLARYRPDGDLEFLGRVDDQVKIRGFRVEPGEIEAVLAAHPAVQEVVATVYQPVPGDRRLAAYVVPRREGTPVTPAELVRFAGTKLPAHMVPGRVIVLEALPLGPTGKIDRRALPRPREGVDQPTTPARRPRGPIEQAVAGMFGELLGTAVGAAESFFDHGGHSLLATRLVSMVRQAFETEISLGEFFADPTVGGVAALVEDRRRVARRPAAPPIKRVSRDGYPALSFAQERLWFLDRFEPGSPLYNAPVAVRLRGRLDVEALRASLEEIARRHEVLRTALPEVDGRPGQLIRSVASIDLPIEDLSSPIAGAGSNHLAALLKTEAFRPFDLDRGPLVRFVLYRLAEEEHVLLSVFHHAVADGWSIGVFLRELGALYGDAREGRHVSRPIPEIQYADFSVWQREWLRDRVLEDELAYWRDALGGDAPPLELPTDRPRPAVQTFRGAMRRFSVPGEILERLRELGRQEGATLFMTLISAFGVLLARYSRQEEVRVGTPAANRGWAETENLIGLFVNTLVIKVDASGFPTFRELVRRVRKTVLGAFDHQDVPFEALVEALQPARNLGRSPLFQVMFTLQEDLPWADFIPGLDASLEEVSGDTAKFELTMSLTDPGRPGKDLAGYLEYNTDLFDPGTAERLITHFRTLLESLTADPDQAVQDAEIMGAAERDEVLATWNDTARSFAAPPCLHHLVETRARQTPERTAVVFRGTSVSYGELETRAERLATGLRSRGVGPDTVVAVCLRRSVEMVVGLLGVLKSGGAYLPLDPSYPPERLSYILQDSRAAVVLTGPSEGVVLPPVEVPVLHVGETGGLGTEGDDQERDRGRDGDPGPGPGVAETTGPPREDNLAYVIYTSGSTGRPKGVMCSHRSVVNQILWLQETYPLSPEDRVLQKTPYGFDVSVLEFFQTLAAGACLIVAEPEGHRDPSYLLRMVREEAITLLHFVPSMLSVFLEEPGIREACAGLRRVICIGEVLVPDLAERFYERLDGATLHNLYGPAEAAVDVTHWDVPRATGGEAGRAIGQPVPIGRPVANTRVYVLDPTARPVPVGVHGEIYIGGVAVARGYAGRPDLTAERFLPDPYGASAGGRLYRTGDLGRFRPDGTIEFLGRLDSQIKLRGFRVELGEIEAVLRAHPEVHEAVVTVREEALGDRRLTAYVTARGRPGTAWAARHAVLRSYLTTILPDYMVPSAWVTLEAFPLNASGKVDRRALPAPEDAGLGQVVLTPPATPLEKAVAAAWAELLGTAEIGLEQDFFSLGGHSLLAVRLIARLRATLGVNLPVRTIFGQPTLREMTAAVERALGSGGAVPASEGISAAPKTDGLMNMVDDLSEEELDSLIDGLSRAGVEESG